MLMIIAQNYRSFNTSMIQNISKLSIITKNIIFLFFYKKIYEHIVYNSKLKNNEYYQINNLLI